MSVEMIKEIMSAEKEAERIIKDAVQKGRQTVAEAREQAYKYVEQAIEEADVQSGRIIEQAERETDEEVRKLHVQTDIECIKIMKDAGDKTDSAVDLLIGRIMAQ